MEVETKTMDWYVTATSAKPRFRSSCSPTSRCPKGCGSSSGINDTFAWVNVALKGASDDYFWKIDVTWTRSARDQAARCPKDRRYILELILTQHRAAQQHNKQSFLHHNLQSFTRPSVLTTKNHKHQNEVLRSSSFRHCRHLRRLPGLPSTSCCG